MGSPLDYFGEFEEGVEVVAIRYFSFASEASLYAAHLKDAGIRCFVSNANSMTMLPLEQAGIGLHIRSEDWEAAKTILQEIDRQVAEAPPTSYHDVDEEEIEYLRSVQEGPQGSNALMWLVALIIGLLIFRTFARAAGWAPSFWDWF